MSGQPTLRREHNRKSQLVGRAQGSAASSPGLCTIAGGEACDDEVRLRYLLLGQPMDQPKGARCTKLCENDLEATPDLVRPKGLGEGTRIGGTDLVE